MPAGAPPQTQPPISGGGGPSSSPIVGASAAGRIERPCGRRRRGWFSRRQRRAPSLLPLLSHGGTHGWLSAHPPWHGSGRPPSAPGVALSRPNGTSQVASPSPGAGEKTGKATWRPLSRSDPGPRCRESHAWIGIVETRLTGNVQTATLTHVRALPVATTCDLWAGRSTATLRDCQFAIGIGGRTVLVEAAHHRRDVAGRAGERWWMDGFDSAGA
jgi:hypothetical protein